MHLFDPVVVQHIVDCTNDRADVVLGDDTDHKTNGLKWTAVDVPTMYVFFALVIIMGVIKIPCVAWYWNHAPSFGGPKLFCKHVMSRNKYMNIMKFLRLSHVSDVIKANPRTRIEPFLDLLRSRCKKMLKPGEHITIDEALILWKSRLLFK